MWRWPGRWARSRTLAAMSSRSSGKATSRACCITWRACRSRSSTWSNFARVRSRRRRAKLLQVDDLDRHARQVMQQALDVAFPDDRDDIAARLLDLAQLPGHRHIPLVDQDALRGRELRRKLAQETLFVPVEALEFRLDLLLAGEEDSQRGCQGSDAFSKGHLSPDASKDHPRVFVDEHDLAPDLLRGPRGGDHFVADLDPILVRDPDLELGEQPEDGPAAAPRLATHDSLVSHRIELEGDDLRSAGQDLCSDRRPDVEDMAHAEKRDHCGSNHPTADDNALLRRRRRVPWITGKTALARCARTSGRCRPRGPGPAGPFAAGCGCGGPPRGPSRDPRFLRSRIPRPAPRGLRAARSGFPC